MSAIRSILSLLLTLLPVGVYAACDATIGANDTIGDVKAKLACFAAESAELRQQLQALKAEAPKLRPRFSEGQWRYLSMPGASGVEVARRLTAIGPPQDSVVVYYDGSQHNTFHIWYRGQGTNTRYTYAWGKAADFVDPPGTNFFLPESGIVPAGVGGEGSTAVPIFFVASR